MASCEANWLAAVSGEGETPTFEGPRTRLLKAAPATAGPRLNRAMARSLRATKVITNTALRPYNGSDENRLAAENWYVDLNLGGGDRHDIS